MQRPIGDRIVVADDRVGQLMHESIRVEAEGVDGIGDGVTEGFGGRDAFVFLVHGFRALKLFLDPLLEPRMRSVLGRHAGDTRLRIVVGAFRLRQGELAEQEEGFAGPRCRPVRVAAAGIEEGLGGFLRARLGELDQFVLDLERAEIGNAVVEFSVQHDPHSL
ncbi:hypothetical protein D9M72_354160 [compost metagenome]